MFLTCNRPLLFRFAVSRWLKEFRADGLRFDSANDIPRAVTQALTWRLHSEFPVSNSKRNPERT